MPYVKDGIGMPPRYVYRQTSRWYEPEKCLVVARTLKNIGIPYKKKTVRGHCAITFGDSYEAYVDSIPLKTVSVIQASIFKFF